MTFCVRPENILLSKSQSCDARETALPVQYSGYCGGALYKVFIDCGFQLIAHVTHQSVKNLGLAEGGKIVASFKATAAHIIRGAAEV